jgi:hypothetical protein
VPLTNDELLELDEQRQLFIEQESQPEHTAEPKLRTSKELEEGIAMQEKVFVYWERADPNFERSEK